MKPSTRPEPETDLRSPFTIPANLVFALGVAISCIAGLAVSWAVRQENLSRFSAEVASVESRIRSRIQRYEDALAHARALFIADQDVTRREFHDFVEGMELGLKYPGIQGLGFARRIRPEELRKHVAEVRASGFPEYHVWPEGKRDEYFSIVYLEPFDWRNRRAFGYDMSTEPVRNAAMQLARDTGAATISSRVVLVQETETDFQPGFLIYLPVYRPGAPLRTLEERRQALIGFVYAPFRSSDFFNGIFSPRGEDRRLVDIQVFDGPGTDPRGELYSQGRQRAEYVAERRIPFDNHEWSLLVRSRPEFERATSAYLVWITLGGGLAINLLILLVLRGARRRGEAEKAHVLEMSRIRRRNELILNSAAEGIFGLDRDGKTTFINPAAERMLGYAPGELLGGIQHSLIHHSRADGSPYPATECPIYAAIHDGAVHELTSEVFWRKDGSSFPVEYSSNPMFEGGKAVGAVVVFRDVSERKAREAQLTEAVRTRDEFLSIASHELKTPLTPLKLQLQMLSRRIRAGKPSDLTPTHLLKAADAADQQVTRLSRLIENLLDVSRINAGRLQLNYEEVDLARLVRELVERFKPEIDAARCAVEVDTRGLGGTFVFDRIRIEQVLANLLTNAIKYAPGTAIRVLATSEGDRVRLAVEDRGRGIAPEDQERIFSRFERATADQRVGGLGLGLYITRQIVEAHRGTIRVESDGRTGASFIVDLPRRPPTERGDESGRGGRLEAS